MIHCIHSFTITYFKCIDHLPLYTYFIINICTWSIYYVIPNHLYIYFSIQIYNNYIYIYIYEYISC